MVFASEDITALGIEDANPQPTQPSKLFQYSLEESSESGNSHSDSDSDSVSSMLLKIN